MENNNVIISGYVSEGFKLNHLFMNEAFYTFKIKSQRLSGTYDEVTCLVSDKIVFVEEDIVGKYVHVTGTVRTFNEHDGDKVHLRMFVYIDTIDEVENEVNTDENKVELTGFVCKKLIRKSPLGRTINDVIIAVNRNYGKTDYIPCVVWGKNAVYMDKKVNIGDEINISGRYQSREYVNKNNEQHTVYEVSVS